MQKHCLIIVFLISSFSFVAAQDSSLFKLHKPGLVLEYQTYDIEYARIDRVKEYHPSTRLLYTVRNAEKDSAGNVVVNLTKQGFAHHTEKQFSWETTTQISFSKENIFFPAGFYISDTTFLCDFQRKSPSAKKRPIVYAAAEFDQQKIVFPFAVQKNEALPLYNFTISARIKDPDIASMNAFVRGKSGPDAASVAASRLSITINWTIVERKVIGKTRITTPAGTFDCYKILEVMDHGRKIKTPRFEHYLYLSPEYGIIKVEPVDMNRPSYYVVLTQIRNK